MTLTTDRDQVRLLIGDTDQADPLLYDDEIDALLQRRSIVYTGGTAVNTAAAAADAADAIAAKFARDYDLSEDGQTFSRAQRVNHFRMVADDLRRRQGGQSVVLTNAGTVTTT